MIHEDLKKRIEATINSNDDELLVFTRIEASYLLTYLEKLENAKVPDFSNCFKYREFFENYHKDWFSYWDSENLIEQAKVLAKMIDSDLVADSLLIDEVMILFNLIRDECVKRIAKSVNVEL